MADPLTSASDTTPPDPRRWRALAVLLLVQFMLILDISAVNIALPTVGDDLGFSRSGLTWVVDAYTLTAGGLLLLGGRLGDLVGRLRTFLVGVVVFGLASVACGAATGAATLVTARFVQGAGEALAAPAALGLIAQARSADPLVPLRFFHDRTRSGGNLVTVFFYAVFFTQFFLSTLYLQQVLGFSALRTGLSFLPFGVAIGAALAVATTLVPRIGIRPVLTAGLVLAVAGVLLFTRITADGSYVSQVLPASVVLALGSGLCLPCLGNAAVNGVTDQDAGLASGLQQALQQVAGAVGLAVLSTLALRHATSVVTGGTDPLVATTDGYVLAYRVGAVLLGVGVVLALTALPRLRSHADAPVVPEADLV